MNRSCRHRWLTLAAGVALGLGALPSPAQQRQDEANRTAAPRPAAPIPGDTRVPIPGDTRAPLGSNRIPNSPPAPADRPRDPAPRPRPSGEPQDLEGTLEHARQLEAEARRRYGLPPADAGAPRPAPHGYRDYWAYDRYGYGGGPGYGPNLPLGADDPGPADWGQDDLVPRDPNGADARNPRPAGARREDDAARPPQLPPDDLLGDDALTPAMKQALDASPEWKQATADLIRAWSAYADAVDGVLDDLQDKPAYRRAKAELTKAKARLDAVQAPQPQGRNVRADATVDRLLSAADGALKTRRAVRQLESAALAADAEVRRAEKRLDDAVERRNAVRDKIVAKLPAADRPAGPKRPRLLEEDE